MANPYNAFTEPQPGVFAFTGPGVPPVTLTGPVAAQQAAMLGQPPANVSAPLALTGMSSAPPMASGLPEERSDAVPNYAPPTGPNGLPGASFTAPARPDALDNPLNAPPEPIASVAPKEELVSKRPDASFAGDRPAPTPTRRIGPGGAGGAAGPVDASGGFLGASNMIAARLLNQHGGGSAGTKADAWMSQTRQTQVQDGRVGAIPMAGYLGAVGSEGAANERVRQEGDALDAQKLAKEVEIEQRAAEEIAIRQREAMLKRQDIRASMEAIVNEADAPDVAPEKWWSSKSTGATIGLGLAAAFAGYNNGKASIKGNPILDSIDRAVERDITAQVQNKDAKDRNKAAKYQRLGQLYSLVKEETGDEVQAMHAAKMVALTITQKQLQQQALQSDSPLAQARYDAAFAAIDRHKADEVMKNERLLQTTRAMNDKFIPKGTGAGGGGLTLKQQLDIAKGQAQLNREFNPSAKPGENPGEMVLGNAIVPLDPTLTPGEKEKARKGAMALGLARQEFEEARRLRGLGFGLADADVQSALKNGVERYSSAKDMGVVTGGEWDVSKDIYRGVGADKALDQVLNSIGRSAHAHTVQYGANKRIPDPKP
ncbi:hypothetical protein K0U83_13780 [bacterium]|nr:hypothetical protein [bacterium]